MNPMAKQSKVTRELFDINVNTVRQLLDVAGRGMGRYLALNADYVAKLADRPGPFEIFELQRHYGETLLTGLREDVEQSGRIIGGALEKSSSALLGAWTASSRAVEAEATETAANVGEIVGQALEQPERALESSLPTESPEEPSRPEQPERSAALHADHHQRENLERVHGIGRAMAQQLRAAGVETLSQLARVDVEELADADHPLHPFRARIEADHWIDQARSLIDPQRH